MYRIEIVPVKNGYMLKVYEADGISVFVYPDPLSVSDKVDLLLREDEKRKEKEQSGEEVSKGIQKAEKVRSRVPRELHKGNVESEHRSMAQVNMDQESVREDPDRKRS